MAFNIHEIIDSCTHGTNKGHQAGFHPWHQALPAARARTVPWRPGHPMRSGDRRRLGTEWGLGMGPWAPIPTKKHVGNHLSHGVPQSSPAGCFRSLSFCRPILGNRQMWSNPQVVLWWSFNGRRGLYLEVAPALGKFWRIIGTPMWEFYTVVLKFVTAKLRLGVW